MRWTTVLSILFRNIDKCLDFDLKRVTDMTDEHRTAVQERLDDANHTNRDLKREVNKTARAVQDAKDRLDASS